MATTLKQLMSTVEEGDKKITDLQTEGNATLDQIRVGIDKFFKNQERSKLDQLENDRERSKIVKQVTAKGSGGSSAKQDVDMMGLAMLAAGLAMAATSGGEPEPPGMGSLGKLGLGKINRTRYMNAMSKATKALNAKRTAAAKAPPPVEPGAREPKPFDKPTAKPGAGESSKPPVKPGAGESSKPPVKTVSISQGNRPLAEVVQKTTTPTTKYATGESARPPVGTGNPAIQMLESMSDADLKKKGLQRVDAGRYGQRYSRIGQPGFISAEVAAREAMQNSKTTTAPARALAETSANTNNSPESGRNKTRVPRLQGAGTKLIKGMNELNAAMEKYGDKYPRATTTLRRLIKVGMAAQIAWDIWNIITAEGLEPRDRHAKLAGVFIGVFTSAAGAAIAGAAAGLIGLTTGPGAFLAALAGGSIAYFYGAWAGEQFAYWLLGMPIVQQLPDLSKMSDKELQAVGLKKFEHEGEIIGYKKLDKVTKATIGQMFPPGSVFLRANQALAAAGLNQAALAGGLNNPGSPTTPAAVNGVASTSASSYPTNGDMVNGEDRAFIGQMENYPNAGRISTDDFRQFNSSSPYYKGAQLSSLEQERARQSSAPPTVVVQQDNRSSSAGSGGGGQSAPPPQSVESKNWALWERLGFGATMQPSP